MKHEYTSKYIDETKDYNFYTRTGTYSDDFVNWLVKYFESKLSEYENKEK